MQASFRSHSSNSLVIKKPWRHAYFHFVDEKKDWLFVAIKVNMAHLQGKIEAQRRKDRSCASLSCGSPSTCRSYDLRYVFLQFMHVEKYSVRDQVMLVCLL
nr:uncharacterized protein LOC112010323 [Quercus suber]